MTEIRFQVPANILVMFAGTQKEPVFLYCFAGLWLMRFSIKAEDQMKTRQIGNVQFAGFFVQTPVGFYLE
jgi:hypothetical protein